VTIEQKAERLLLDRSVVIKADAARVKGDHGEYSVIFRDGRWWCSCPARKKCSHILAVELVTA
jgi:hypothetical protein